ncbi:MAG: response regulator [Sedimentisphaerales bacterium]|nr:response regulator [Sedimentisphaerales bacterium]
MNQKNKKITVLVVDDDPDFLLQHELLLKNAGFDVITADSQKAAEDFLKQQLPDLAVVDLMMENADGGFALCYHIKKRSPDIPVIIVTAVASETGLDFDTATAEERSWIKADALLTKPVRFEQLQREIKRLIK